MQMKRVYKKLFVTFLTLIISFSFAGQVWADTNFIWAKSFDVTSSGSSKSLYLDTSGNVYTTGYFDGTADFDPGAGTSNLTSAGSADIFISKLDSSGNFVWVKQIGGSNNEIVKSIKLDSSDNIYTTGYFEGTVDFDPGAGTSNLTSAGSADIFISKLDSSGNFVWAKSMGGIGDDIGYGIKLDSSGNVYTAGSFEGTVDFDPGAGTSNLTSAGGADIFISKLDSSGNFVWAKSMGGTGGDIEQSIEVDSSGNVYTTGYFQGTTDFDPGAGTSNLTSAGGADIFISKLDSSGNFVWVKQIGGLDDEFGLSLYADSLGNIYTTGTFLGTPDFDPGVGTANLTSVGDEDIFISKLDSSGNFVWAKQMGGLGADRALEVFIDSSDNVYTTGYFEGTVDFDPGAGTSNLTSAGDTDIFISRLDSSGNFVWAKGISGIGGGSGNSLYLDSSDNIYTTGYFEGTTDFDPGAGTTNLTSTGNTPFILKLSQTSAPTTSTTSASSITTTTAVLTGNITDTGGEANTERGFDIGTDNTYAMSDVEDVTGSYSTGSYSLTATGSNMWYHIPLPCIQYKHS
jgi:hypothetical protein